MAANGRDHRLRLILIKARVRQDHLRQRSAGLLVGNAMPDLLRPAQVMQQRGGVDHIAIHVKSLLQHVDPHQPRHIQKMGQIVAAEDALRLQFVQQAELLRKQRMPQDGVDALHPRRWKL